ncbi:MAG: hypothetical protein WD266_03060 [Balneolales bacterium]
MLKKELLILLCLLAAGSLTISMAQDRDNLQISGYVQGMPLWIQAELPGLDADAFWEYRLQNRLNLQYYLSPDWTFTWEMRTRFFAGELVKEIPFYAEGIGTDDRFFDLSWMIADRTDWLLHYIPDRLYVDWYTGDWSVRVGRQRINWGINTLTNPNDLFNIYSFYDFDYPERPGTDAIRIQRYTGLQSRWELAVSPGREPDESVAALMYAFNTNGYDIQVLSGYYRHRLALGGGWAGSINQTGFKGEAMLFSDLDKNSYAREINFVMAVSADHMFDNSMFLVLEALFNQSGGQSEFQLIGERLSADNPSFSRYQATGQVTYPFSPLLNGSLACVYYPDEPAVFISPSVTYSVLQDLDLNVLAQLFTGSDDSAFGNAGNVVAGSLKWSF